MRVIAEGMTSTRKRRRVEEETKVWSLEEVERFWEAWRCGRDPVEDVRWEALKERMVTDRSISDLRALVGRHRRYVGLPGATSRGLYANICDERERPKVMDDDGLGEASAHPEFKANFPKVRIADEVVDARVRRCVCNPKLRRWVEAEWCYSFIDLPFFQASQFGDIVRQGLGIHPEVKLLRAEWSSVRAALCDFFACGTRPRRLSKAFLRDERLKLEEARKERRMLLREVVEHKLPLGSGTDLAPLVVGERIRTRHREFGRVLPALVTRGGEWNAAGECTYEVAFDSEPESFRTAVDVDIMRCRRPASCVESLLPPEIRVEEPTKQLAFVGSLDEGCDSAPLTESRASLIRLARFLQLLDSKEGLILQLARINNHASRNAESAASRRSRAQFTRVCEDLVVTNERLDGLSVDVFKDWKGKLDAPVSFDIARGNIDAFAAALVQLCLEKSPSARFSLERSSVSETVLSRLTACTGVLLRAAVASNPSPTPAPVSTVSNSLQPCLRPGAITNADAYSLLQEVIAKIEHVCSFIT